MKIHVPRCGAQLLVAIAVILIIIPIPKLLLAADSDEREVRESPTYYPWYTVCKVRIGDEGRGRGSGVLVSPCTILTNGHVVYKYNYQEWRPIYTVSPGSYYDESKSSSVDPYGTKRDINRATNTKYVNTGDGKYDYGAIFIATSFEDLGVTTYLPLRFEYEVGYVNLSGYPCEELPESGTGKAKEQWWGHGDVKSHSTRTMKYEATSTGGASGAPVWVYYSSSEERYLVAINRAHHNNDNDGTGVRLVSQNEDLIEAWVDRDCEGPGAVVGDKSAKTASKIPFKELLRDRVSLKGSPIEVLDPEVYRLIPPPSDLTKLSPAAKVMQWIEGEFYVWEEFLAPGGEGNETLDDGSKKPERTGRPNRRFIRMLKPERRVLKTDEAAVLLSASKLWLQPADPINPIYYQEGKPVAVRPPAPRDSADDDPNLPDSEFKD